MHSNLHLLKKPRTVAGTNFPTIFSKTCPFGQFGIKVPYTKSVSFKIILYLKKVIIIGRKIAVNIPLSPIASAPNAAAFSLISIARAVPIP